MDNKNSRVIHLFALLHALVAFGCRLAGITDDIMLTLLSMLMVVIICLNRRMNVKFMALWTVLANIFGYLLGFGTSWLFLHVIANVVVVYPLSTFICTEILGWCVELCCVRMEPRFGQRSNTGGSNIKWVLAAIVLILIIRMILLLLNTGGLASHVNAYSIFVDYIFSCLALVVLAEHAIRYSTRAEKEKEKANLAQYRYRRLKQQVDPHFLFNSLNILDYMVQDKDVESASKYIHKMADIYRYMIRNEEELTVTLREEMDFMQKYIDLLKVRFADGLDVEIDIPESALGKRVVPCCLQMLIENVTKHNVVSSSSPMHVRLHSDGEGVTVVNELRPKIRSLEPSTGLGLKYICRQYSDLCSRDVVISKTEAEYSVTIPLI